MTERLLDEIDGRTPVEDMPLMGCPAHLTSLGPAPRLALNMSLVPLTQKRACLQSQAAARPEVGLVAHVDQGPQLWGRRGRAEAALA
jgi:hypothetical protein